VPSAYTTVTLRGSAFPTLLAHCEATADTPEEMHSARPLNDDASRVWPPIDDRTETIHSIPQDSAFGGVPEVS